MEFAPRDEDPHSRRRRIAWILGALAAPSLVFVLLASWRIEWPGLYYDEVLFANASLGVHDNPYAFVHWGNVPIMIMPYLGALKAWIFAAIFSVWGASPFTVRFPAVLIASLSIPLTYSYVRRLFSPGAAALAAWLTALEPGFAFHSRWDWGPTALMMTLKAGFLAAFCAWLTTGRRMYLAGAILAAGLGVFDKLNFIWVVNAAIAAAVIARWCLLRRIARTRPLVLAAVATPLVCGAVLILALLVHKGELGWGGAGVVPRFALNVLSTITGLGPYRFIFADETISWVPLVTLLSAFTTAVPAWGLGPARHKARRSLLFVTLLITFLAMQILLTRQATGVHHTILLSPLWVVGLAGLLSDVLPAGSRDLHHVRPRTVGYRMPRLLLAFGAVVGVLLSSGVVHAKYARAIGNRDCIPYWDGGTSQLGVLHVQNPQLRWIVVDWGIANTLQVHAQGRSKVLEMCHWITSDRTGAEIDWFESQVTRADTRILAWAPERLPRLQTRRRFQQQAAARGWIIRSEKLLVGTDGRPLFEILRVGLPGSARGTAPRILALHPSSIVAGAGCNVQPNGMSAIAVTCYDATPDTVIYFNGRPLDTVVRSLELSTAWLPSELLVAAGRYPVWLENYSGRSRSLDFVVTPR